MYAQLIETVELVVGAAMVAEVLILVLNHLIMPALAAKKTDLNNWVIQKVQWPIRLIAFLGGLYLADLWVLNGSFSLAGVGFSTWFTAAVILVFAFTVSNLLDAFLLWYFQRISPFAHEEGQAGDAQGFPMLRRLVAIAIYVMAALIVLGMFGVQITPLLTGLGIAGLAVALALSDSLTNFFAGLYLLGDKPVKVGDFISMTNNNGTVTGHVEEIGWHSTRIRTQGNYNCYIPNQTLASNNIINFSRGQDNNWKGSSVNVAVSYKTNPQDAGRVLAEAVKAVRQRNSLMTKDFEPQVRFDDFSENAMNFKVTFGVSDYAESEKVCDEVRKEILKACEENQIALAYDISAEAKPKRQEAYEVKSTPKRQENLPAKAVKVKRKKPKEKSLSSIQVFPKSKLWG